MLKDRNVRTRDNRRRSSRSELPPQTAKIVIDLRRLCRAKRESGSILENTPDLRVERFSAIDLLLGLEKRTVCDVELGYRGRASCGISLPEHIETGFFPSENQVYRSSQFLPLRTFRSDWRAECSARPSAPSSSGRQRVATCPNARLPFRRRPSCRCRRRRSPYHSGHR